MRKVLEGAAVAALMLSSLPALAEDRPVANAGRFYVGIAPGWIAPEDTKFSGSASSGGYTANASGKFEFEDGYSLSGFAGYRFNDYVRGEAEVAYASFDYDRVVLNGTITGNGRSYAVSGSADLDGSVTSTIGMVSAIVSPFGNARIAPLVGAGIGFATTEDEINRIGGVAANLSETHTDLALSAMAGLEFAATDRMSLGVRYRYFWVDSGGDGIDDFTAHNVTANASMRF